MKIILIVIIAFLVLIYVYTYIRYKKRKKNQISTVENYRKNYLERIDIKTKYSTNTSLSELPNKITKYNSSIDYIEWNDFVTEVNEQKKASDLKKAEPKRLQY